MADRNIIRLSKSCIGEEEIEHVVAVLKNGYLGMGTEVKHFEDMLTAFFGRQAICVNTGTAALHLALQALDITTGDEVLVPTLTYVASYQAISATGATPVACDIRNDNISIDITDAEKKITSRTKAIMPVFYASNASIISDVYNFAHKNGLRVVEDAAHAFGSIYDDKLIGSFGDISCFSLDGIKNITSGEGGVVVTDDVTIIQKVQDYRLLGVQKDTEKRYNGQRSWDFDVEEQGWRFHMSNVMAAIGIEQLKKMELFREQRRSIALKYDAMLAELPLIGCLNINYREVNPHIYVIRVLNNLRDQLKDFLEKKGIQTGMHYKPNHLLSKYKSYYEFPVAEKFYGEMLTLPMHPDVSDADVAYITDCIKEFFPGNI